MSPKRTTFKLTPADAPSVAAIMAGDERWFRAVADYTIDWESWHGPDGRLLWVNPAVERITGYSVRECLAMPDYPLPLILPEDRATIANALGAARERKAGENLDFRCLPRTGESRWMSLSWQPMHGERRRYLGFRTSARDVTERRALREQLRLHAEHLEQLVQERTERVRQLEQRQRQMEKLAALGQLAAGVAHEINNPLAGVRNAFALIKSGLSPEQEHFELLELVDREIERISGIVHQMYQLYRPNPQQPSEFSMKRVVVEVASLLDTVARRRDVSLQINSANAPTEVLLPENEVKQILYNLIGNGIQASPPKSVVFVRTKYSAREVSVQITDSGSGIREAILPRIFDPFFSTKQGGPDPGMGLGLSVSRSLIEAMGGRIEVTTKLGRGSVFSAIFPRRLSISELNA